MRKPSAARLAAIIGLGVAAYTVGTMYQPTVVVGESMSPTLPDGKLIYIDRTYYQNNLPRRGEVVVFQHGGNVYVKRVYRAPGEKVHYLTDGEGVVGLVSERRARELRERYQRWPSKIRVVTLRVPKDSVYVLGDNYAHSEDSRQLGPILIDELIGRAHVEIDTSIAWQNELRPHFRTQPSVVGTETPAETPQRSST